MFCPLLLNNKKIKAENNVLLARQLICHISDFHGDIVSSCTTWTKRVTDYAPFTGE